MDEQFRDGFERMLSDVPEPPSWESLAPAQAPPTPVPTRGRGVLIAAAAFGVTIVAVGAVILVLARGSGPIPPVALDTIDYVKIAWVNDVELSCGELTTVDNGGFDRATVEVWGPDPDDLLRIDVTAPDGTTDRLVFDYDMADSDLRRSWYAYDGPGSARADDPYRIADCIRQDGNETWSYIPQYDPVSMANHLYPSFVAFPTTYGNGRPWDFEADLSKIGETRRDEWRGVPVTVYTEASTGTFERHVSEHWVDSRNQRYERRVEFLADTRYGMTANTVEVVERANVPVGSVSFSTDGMALIYDGAANSPRETLETIDAEITRRQASVDDATEQRIAAEETVRESRATLHGLQTQTDPPATQVEIDRAEAIVRMSELQVEYLSRIIQQDEAMIASLSARRQVLLSAQQARTSTP